MKKLICLVVVVSLAAGCGGEEKKDAGNSELSKMSKKELDEFKEGLHDIASKADAKRASKWAEMAKEKLKTLKIAEFPNSGSTVKVGQTVFAPHAMGLARVREKGGPLMSFSSHEVIAVGADVATLKPSGSSDVPSEDFVVAMPHVLIIPVPESETLDVGDQVLATKGEDMRRAIVTKSGDAAEGWDPLFEQTIPLNAGQVRKLASPWQPGTFVAWEAQPKIIQAAMVIAVDGEKALVSGDQGVQVIDKSAAIPLPTRPAAKAGDEVWGNISGRQFLKGKYIELDESTFEHKIDIAKPGKDPRIVETRYYDLSTESLDGLIKQ